MLKVNTGRLRKRTKSFKKPSLGIIIFFIKEKTLKKIKMPEVETLQFVVFYRLSKPLFYYLLRDKSEE